MDHRTIRALNGLHRRDPDLAHILTELLMQTAVRRKAASTRSAKSEPSSPRIVSAAVQWLIAILTAVYIFRGGDIGTALKALSLISG